MKNKTLQYYGAASLAMFFWSFSFVWFKAAYKAYEPMPDTEQKNLTFTKLSLNLFKIRLFHLKTSEKF